jgi:hypothetical protein
MIIEMTIITACCLVLVVEPGARAFRSIRNWLDRRAAHEESLRRKS